MLSVAAAKLWEHERGKWMQRIARLNHRSGGEVGNAEGAHLFGLGCSPSPNARLQAVVNCKNRSD